MPKLNNNTTPTTRQATLDLWRTQSRLATCRGSITFGLTADKWQGFDPLHSLA